MALSSGGWLQAIETKWQQQQQQQGRSGVTYTQRRVTAGLGTAVLLL
jgi:hypothetical protein